METITIGTESKTYPVYVGLGAVQQLNSYIYKNFPSLTNIMIITDETVASLYLTKLQDNLSDFETFSYVAPIGERAKTFEVYYQVLSFALERKLDRKSLIIAFGGGAVGDLGGFIAATYMRGIPFIQVPTTILAHDSAVGGKTAINHPLGKNMIGAFYQPEAVFYDLNFLSSLPLNERRSGFAEVIKHGLIHDPIFFTWLMEKITTLRDYSHSDLAFSLIKGIEIKNYFVSKDEKESGIRAYLNFGHTLGHAIEAELGYGEWTHGEAVLVGMLFALKLSKKITDLDFNTDNFKAWLEHLGYKTEIPKELSREKLLERMKQDKKSVGQKVNFVLLKEVGSPVLYEVSDEEILIQLEIF
ncbi:3-dehydroquinate synthase [Cytobacillus dafuensis]|uniref:3-dehydroquinate synthase n=1 Tax=Cytobacillus dafuensis TaxID=1742359 RepID=A0A5B8Z5Q6_CYTDA|nr:3-dehydroquinate synthase [Cytobacillus dafuensis]QED48432.1 3-dehydroquinate synthase [Cytobacillus dafuensis]